jgi:uncharacterized OB-fold protein
MDGPRRPLPVPDEGSKGFWENARQHVLSIQRCEHCGNLAHPPVEFCAVCHRLDRPLFRFEPVSGRGRLVTWTVIHRSIVAGFEQESPWTNAIARLDEQEDLFLLASLERSEGQVLAVGDPVEVVFSDISSDISLPLFRVAEEQ